MKLYYPDPGMTLHGENACKFLGFEKYDPLTDMDQPAMFWLYFPEDYEYLLAHKGPRYVYWHGADVLRLLGMQELWPYLLSLRHDIIHACHNHILSEQLAQIGIYALIRPVFWNDVSKYPDCCEWSPTPEVYITAHPGREIEYGEGYMIALSKVFPELRFHIYGIDGEESDNLIYHGSIPEAVMDSEIKDMQICLRMKKHDGFSQTAMKALLFGHYLITGIKYKGIPYAENFEELVQIISEYTKQYFRNCDYVYWRKEFNNFDWIK